MRHIATFMFALLLLVHLGVNALRPDHCGNECVSLDCDQRPSRSDSVDQTQPAGIEDRALLAHLVEQGRKLIEQDRVVEMETLIEQLDLDGCHLDLPDPQTIADDPVEVYARARDGVVVVGGLYKCKK